MSVGINYWDDPKGLIKILTNDTVYDYVDKFYIIDGRYKDRLDLPEHDPDYLRDLKKIYSKIESVDMAGSIQIDKRNKYWELAEKDEMDYLIVCDSDEYITINPQTFSASLRNIDNRPEQCYPVRTVGVMIQKRPRLFKAPFTFRHRENKGGNGISHGSLYTDYGKSDKEVIAQMYAWYIDHPKREKDNDNHLGVPGIVMYHDKEYRSKDRVIADRVYYDETKNR